jgi:hypothetical protein
VSTFLKRLAPLVIAICVVAAPIAESAAPGDAVAGAAKKGKKGKKCKSKKKGKKAGKKAKCKKQQGSAGSPGLPGKPVDPNPPAQPAQPDPLQLSLQLTENPLLGGSSGPGRVTISAPAPAGGQPVTLSSGDLSLATLPDAVHIAAGQTSDTFDVLTFPVDDPTSVILTAAIGTSDVDTAQLDIVDEADLSSVALAYQCFPDEDPPDFFGGNLVSLNVRAPTDTDVALSSSAPTFLSVPPIVTVPEGSFTGGFGVNTLLAIPSVTVTASLAGSIDRTDTARVRNSLSLDPVSSGLSLQPDHVIVGDPSTGTVSLDCEAPAGGTTVSLAAVDPDTMLPYPGVTVVPASVLVPAGELSANFTINTVGTAVPGDVLITATPGVSVDATLTLEPQPN